MKYNLYKRGDKMLYGIILSIAAILGIITGIKKKNKSLAIISAIGLIVIIAIWVYFYTHPY
jgi:hypothetical protein